MNKVEKIILSLNPGSMRCQECREFRHPVEFKWIDRFGRRNDGFHSTTCVYCDLNPIEIEKAKYRLIDDNKDATVDDIDKRIEHARRNKRKYYTDRRKEKIRRNNFRLRS